MRNLQLEAAIWYFFIAPEFYEMAAKECEDTMQWFGKLASSRGATNFGRNNQIYDSFRDAARNFYSAVQTVRHHDYEMAHNAASKISSDIRGMMEQPFHSWMSTSEYKEFSTERVNRILAYTNKIRHTLDNATTSAERFLHPDTDFPDLKDRDDGFPNDEIIDFYEFALKEEKMPWMLPTPLPQYVIDISRACKTGEEVPWTGVWYPAAGLERHSLTFAIKGLRMQPAYTVTKTVEELRIEKNDPWIMSCETKAIATTWHPVVPVDRIISKSPSALRAKAGEPCPKSGMWRSLDPKAMQHEYKQDEIMKDNGSAYGFTVWEYIG